MNSENMNYDYGYLEINKVAEKIQEVLANYVLKEKHGIYINLDKNYKKNKRSDIDYLVDDKSLTDAVIKRLEQCLITIREAAICAKHVEWLVRSTYIEEKFCMGLDNALAESRKTSGVM